nr:ROK family transcriptional regulator [Deinobacterium chartae]
MRLVRRAPGIARAELSRRTGLTKATVSTLVQELELEGWLRAGTPQHAGSGRPATPLYLDDTRLVLVGAELGADYRNAVALDLTGRILSQRYARTDHAGPEAALAALATDLEAVLAEERVRTRRVVGLGVAVPGPVHAGSGRMPVAPNLGWTDVPVRDLMDARLHSPTLEGTLLHVENEANAGALTESIFGIHPLDGPLVYLSLGVGVGGGIVMGDRVFHGYGGYAGEIGHLTLLPDGPGCRCGTRGCAEALIGQRAISAAAGSPDLSVDDLLSRLRAGDPATHAAVQRAGEYLGILISNLIHTFNPQMVVLGGPLAELGDALLEPACQEARRRGLHRLVEQAQIRRCRYGRDAGAIGAAARALHAALSPAMPEPASWAEHMGEPV